MSNVINNHERQIYTVTPDMLTRETLDQRENLGGNDAHKMMYEYEYSLLDDGP